MEDYKFLFWIFLILILLITISYIYGKTAAKRVIKYSIQLPIIFLLIVLIIWFLLESFNFISGLSGRTWKGIFFMSVISLSAFGIHLDNKKKIDDKKKLDDEN